MMPFCSSSLIEAEDNIQDAFSISGDADFILKVVAENLEQLSQFVTERLPAVILPRVSLN
jgi:DNA-binding Lrp family transcriptional regulator